jgi:hypothetical protein
MTGATTTDAKSVSVSYTISGADVPGPLAFNVYRSSAFDSLTGAQLIGTASLPASDTADLSVGTHQGVRLSLTGPNGNPLKALTPNTALPFLVVVANPGGTVAESDQPNDVNNVASFETHVLGVVTHGLEYNLLSGKTPKWETQMAMSLMQKDGYEAAIAFNWVRASGIPLPGLAVKAGDRLAQQVLAEANQLASQHPGDVVDINWIGHSRGNVVTSRALQDLVGTTDPALQGGYMEMTLLDPHPASNRFGLFSFVPANRLADLIAKGTLLFQAFARDPQVVVPPDVQQVGEFYQHTSAGRLFHSPSELFLNLWGDPPGLVANQSGQPIPSKNLTGVRAPGVGLVGHIEVHNWYQVNVVDTNQTFNYFGQ